MHGEDEVPEAMFKGDPYTKTGGGNKRGVAGLKGWHLCLRDWIDRSSRGP